MKGLKKIGIISVILSSMLFANTQQNSDEQLVRSVQQEINTIKEYGLKPINTAEKKHLLKILNQPERFVKFYGKRKAPVKNFTEYYMNVRGRPFVLYKNNKENYYMAGYFYNKKGENLTLTGAKNVFENIHKVQYNNFFKQVKEKAPHFIIEIKGDNPKGGEVILYTDPQCPFCKRFEKFGGLEYLKKHYFKIYVVQYPLSFHKEADKRSYWIIQNASKAKTADEKIKIIKEGSNKPYKEIVKETKISYPNELKELRNIKTPPGFGTPTVMSTEGKDLRDTVMKNILIERFHLKPSQIKTGR